MQPWQMTAQEWAHERESVRPNYVQENFTRASGSQAVARAQRLAFLLFDARDVDRQRLKDAGEGKIKMTREEVDEALGRINTPIDHRDVVEKALRMGLPVPSRALLDYPDLMLQVPAQALADYDAESVQAPQATPIKVRSRSMTL